MGVYVARDWAPADVIGARAGPGGWALNLKTTLLLTLTVGASLSFALNSYARAAQDASLIAFKGLSKDASKSVGTKSDGAADAAPTTPYPVGSEDEKLYLFGTRQMEAGDFKKARDTFRTLAYKRPNDADPMLKVSMAAFKAGDVDDGLDWAKKACVISPKYPEAHLQLAHLFEANQDWKAACLQYEVIYELEPTKQSKLNIEYPMLRSLIRSQEYEKAEKLSNEWIRQYKRSADAFFNRAWTLSQIPDQGNTDEILNEAIKNYRVAIKLDPKRHDARFNMALLLVKAKQDQAACTELETFVQEAPDDPDASRAKSLLSKLRSAKAK